MLRSEGRVAVLLSGGIQGTQGKTGLAFIRFRPERVAVVIDPECVGESLRSIANVPCDAPIVGSVSDALAFSPEVLLIGIAPSGGALPEEWLPELRSALSSGLSLMNGLHTRLAEIPELKELLNPQQWIWDIRQEPAGLKVGSGQARLLPCRRVLTVGTDMSVGKMSTSLAIDRAAQAKGVRSRFLGTGQAGIMIAGDGIALDAVRVDFASGAVEQLVMRYGNDYEMLHVEGQGSLLNPASTATLPLIRGSQPTHMILVHRAGQTQIKNFTHVSIPRLKEVVKLYESVAFAGGAFGPAKVSAIALNTAHLDQSAATRAIALVQEETGLPCSDPIRFGADVLLASVLNY